MQLSVMLPTLRHFRIINILGLFGTSFTAWCAGACADILLQLLLLCYLVFK
jgi:hypothetical protein